MIYIYIEKNKEIKYLKCKIEKKKEHIIKLKALFSAKENIISSSYVIWRCCIHIILSSDKYI